MWMQQLAHCPLKASQTPSPCPLPPQAMALVQVRDQLDQYGVGQVSSGWRGLLCRHRMSRCSVRFMLSTSPSIHCSCMWRAQRKRWLYLLVWAKYASTHPIRLPIRQALSYLNAKCSDNYMRALVTNSVFAHVSRLAAPSSICMSLVAWRKRAFPTNPHPGLLPTAATIVLFV